MKVLNFISRIFDPLVRLIDELHTSDEERSAAKQALDEVRVQALTQAIDLEKANLEARASIIRAEAAGQSWLQRNWRPILMLSIVGILLNNFILSPWLAVFGVDAPVLDLPPELFTLMTFGVGGYIVGRSAEKVTPQLAEAIGRRGSGE